MRIQTRHLHAKIAYRLVEYVIAHQQGRLRVPELAQVVGMSPAHLTRLFQEQTGEALSVFVRRICLERAAHRLSHTDLPVASVAFEAGYDVVSNFGRAFRSAFGVKPSDYRGRKGGGTLASPADLHWSPDGRALTLRPADLTELEPEVEIVSRPEMPYVFWRFEGRYSDIRKAWEEIGSVVPDSASAFLTVYHDNSDTRPVNRMRADLGFFGEEAPEGWLVGSMPEGAYVRSLAESQGHDHHMAWCTMHRHWIPRQGERPSNVPAFEVSSVCPGTVHGVDYRVWIGLELDLGLPEESGEFVAMN